jgi:ATP-binding cassette subfamily F protein 3
VRGVSQPAAARPVVNREQERTERKRQRRLAALEEEIAMIEAEIKQIENELGTAGIAGDTKRMTALSLQHAELQDMLHSRYDEWAAVAG